MADDMRWVPGTTDHVKVLALVTAHGERAFRALVHLWEYAARHKPSGNLGAMTDQEIAAAAGWPDAPAGFAETLRILHLTDRSTTPPERTSVHDWRQHQPWVYGRKARSKRAKRLAKGSWSDEARERRAMRIAMRHAGKNPAARNAPSPSPGSSSEGRSPPDARGRAQEAAPPSLPQGSVGAAQTEPQSQRPKPAVTPAEELVGMTRPQLAALMQREGLTSPAGVRFREVAAASMAAREVASRQPHARKAVP